ncbi:preQ(1) synthase [Lentisphaerota bacterium WC36G]|nr:preQ(1) synthase [Lentisphaerae bacterium WC36]
MSHDKSRLDKLTLLKANESNYPKSPSEAKLETFVNQYPERDYVITFNCPEFTALCPVTGQPDFGKITIRYIADKECVESKSLKLFLFSFRNHNSFHEEVVNIILTEIDKVCSPRWCEVEGDFMPRGGIALNIKASVGKKPE